MTSPRKQVFTTAFYMNIFLCKIIFKLQFSFYPFLSFLIMRIFCKPFLPIFCTVAAFFVLLSCKTDPKTAAANQLASSAAPAIVLPSAPEDVVRMWEVNYDQNNFANIEPISAGESLKMVKAMNQTSQMAKERGEMIDAFTPNIVQVSCEVSGDMCDCICLINDPKSGRYNMKYELLRDNGQWKVTNSGDEKSMKNEKAKSKDAKKPL